jgi:hypothetical protein
VSVTLIACVLSAGLGGLVTRLVRHVQRKRADAAVGKRPRLSGDGLAIACGVLAGAIGVAGVAVVQGKAPSVVGSLLFVYWLWFGLWLGARADVDEDEARDGGP